MQKHKKACAAKMADKMEGTKKKKLSSNEEFQKAGGGHFNSKTQGYHSKLSQLLKFVILLQIIILIIFIHCIYCIYTLQLYI